MKCPACSNNLKETMAGDVAVDVCDGGCGGVWFDKDELDKFDEPHEFQAEVILKVPRSASPQLDRDIVRNCPKCTDQILWRQFFDIHNEVEIDQCPACSGIWLDVGELDTIRHQYKTDEERHKAAEMYLDAHRVITENKIKADIQQRIAAEPKTPHEGLVQAFREIFGWMD